MDLNFNKEAEEITHAFPKNPSKLNGIIFHGISFFDYISVGLT